MINNVSFKGLPSNTRYVSEKLIVGAKQGLLGLRKLKKEEGVNAVIDLRRKTCFSFLPLEKFYCRILGLKYNSIPFSLSKENFPLKNSCDKAVDIISQNKSGKTFVHCLLGKHRSVLICAASEIKNSKIKNEKELENFLHKQKYYEIKYKLKHLLGLKNKKDLIKRKMEKINREKQRFLEIIFGEK